MYNEYVRHCVPFQKYGIQAGGKESALLVSQWAGTRIHVIASALNCQDVRPVTTFTTIRFQQLSISLNGHLGWKICASSTNICHEFCQRLTSECTRT